ncbi:MAG: hypothetical protein M3422_10630 [Actinomycetota bacterium]|nr:hypothetical protein [Actinomycetota bacterium]
MPAFATSGPITAAVTTAGARVRVTASERSDAVVLVEPLDGASKTDVKVAERTKVQFADGRLSIATTKSGDKKGSVAITVALPAGSDLVLHTAWSTVDVDGALGDCELNLSTGQVRLDRVGTLLANLAAGDVEVQHVTGTTDVEGGSAGLRIGTAEGTVRYQGATGKVWVGHAMSDIELGGSGGSLDIDRADGNVVAKAANCPIRVGRITRGRAELMNASGGIHVGVSGAASVDADSTKGTVRNSLPALDTAAHTVTIHARTRLDDIVIQPAAV